MFMSNICIGENVISVALLLVPGEGLSISEMANFLQIQHKTVARV